MKNKIIIIILFLIASTLSAQDKKQDSYSFNLKEAIDHALQNNYSVINANRDIDSAKEKSGKPQQQDYPK
ncbi:hypothetical protein ACFQZF_02525 [Flavobacterium myungsuense]|uniref:hypothetical protein n=1 Tax=Flavobacterium myungsuense TaxID=651823 RepID=UPI00362C1DF8